MVLFFRYNDVFRVIFMDKNTDKLLVSKSNHLIEAGYKLTLNEQRLILTAISKLDGRKPFPKDNEFIITAQEFCKAFDIPIKQAYENLENASSRLYERDIKTYDKSNHCRERFRWVDGVKYWDKEGKVSLSFSNRITPYLTLLHTQLTSYNLNQISKLNSSYAIRFFELLIQFKSTQNRWISLETLKERLEIPENYSRFYDLKRRIIDPSIKNINETTSLFISWSVVKKGKTIIGLSFNIIEKEFSKTVSAKCPRTMDMMELIEE